MYKLLIADDENEIGNAIRNYFPWDEIGFEVVDWCENGKQALDYINRNAVHVIFCDIQMPVMSGLELADQLHKQKSQVKVVFLSGHSEFEYARKALSLGVKDYLVKPAKYKELLNVFSRIKLELDEEHLTPPIESSYIPDNDEERMNHSERIIAAIKRYIEECYCDAQLDDAAKVVHMNPNYLSHIFKQKTGQNFSEYLVSIRMRKAAELLRDVKYKIYDVSSMVGYSSPKNFARTFKGYYGKTPSEYRQHGGYGE